MSIPAHIVDAYMQASENLMKLDDLTDVDIEAVQKMLDRLSEKFNSEHDN